MFPLISIIALHRWFDFQYIEWIDDFSVRYFESTCSSIAARVKWNGFFNFDGWNGVASSVQGFWKKNDWKIGKPVMWHLVEILRMGSLSCLIKEIVGCAEVGEIFLILVK